MLRFVLSCFASCSVSYGFAQNSEGMPPGNIGIGVGYAENILHVHNGTSLLGTQGSVSDIMQISGSSGYSLNRLKATLMRHSTGQDWISASFRLQSWVDVTKMGYLEFNPIGAPWGLSLGSGDNEFLRFLSNGYMGKGIATPQAPFHILNNDNISSIMLESNGPGWGSGIVLKNVASSGRSFGLYSGAEGNFHISDNNATTDRLLIKNNGFVGVGTNSPQEKLQIGDRFVIHDGGAKVIGYNWYYTNTDYRLQDGPVSSIAFEGDGDIHFRSGEAGPANTPVTQHRINLSLFNDGSVAVSAPHTPGYKLAVGGSIIAEKVKVKLQSQWPDFVFDPGYPLMNLNELSLYISKYKHLPNVPSAHDVKSTGIDLGSNQALLLQKIEELTLYILEQEKRLAELEQLKSEVQQLRDVIHKLKISSAK